MSTATSDEIDYRRRLGKVIVQLRVGQGMSQATLAERINRSEAALSRWETGKATPSAFDLREIARTFRLPPEAIDVLLYPPAVYGPEMERVFAAIAEVIRPAAPALPSPGNSSVLRAEALRKQEQAQTSRRERQGQEVGG